MERAGIDPRVAPAMYRALGKSAIDLLSLRSRVTIDESALVALDRALAEGPVVLFASHTGNWELAAAAAAEVLAVRGRRLVVVAKRFTSGSFDRFVARLRRKRGVTTIPPEGAVTNALAALRAGDVVAMPIDQRPDAPWHGDPLDFLGATALVDRAPATIAWRARATALVIAGEGDRVRLLGVIPPSPNRRRTMARATALLESFVRKSPASWMWLHRRWRSNSSVRWSKRNVTPSSSLGRASKAA